jgi:hypothetical protein
MWCFRMSAKETRSIANSDNLSCSIVRTRCSQLALTILTWWWLIVAQKSCVPSWHWRYLWMWWTSGICTQFRHVNQHVFWWWFLSFGLGGEQLKWHTRGGLFAQQMEQIESTCTTEWRANWRKLSELKYSILNWLRKSSGGRGVFLQRCSSMHIILSYANYSSLWIHRA